VKIPERVINGDVAFWKTIHVYIEAPCDRLLQTDPAPIRGGTSDVALTGKGLGTPGLDRQYGSRSAGTFIQRLTPS